MKTYANDALGSDQLDELILDGSLGVALGISLEVAQISDVTDVGGAVAVGCAVGVDCFTPSVGLEWIKVIEGRETNSEGRPRCSRWCCRQRCECACHASRWDPDPRYPRRRW